MVIIMNIFKAPIIINLIQALFASIIDSYIIMSPPPPLPQNHNQNQNQ